LSQNKRVLRCFGSKYCEIKLTMTRKMTVLEIKLWIYMANILTKKRFCITTVKYDRDSK